MIYSGIAVLAFITIHMLTINAAGATHKEAYDKVVFVLSNPFSAACYVLGILALGLHLFHGAASTFQSLGLKYPKYDNVITVLGRASALILTAGFASIPAFVWLSIHGGGIR